MILSQLKSQDLTTVVGSEMELLLCCARTQLDASTVARVKSLLNREVDFAELDILADKHRVKPLVYQNLGKYATEAVNPIYFQQLRQECRYNSWRNMNLMNSLIEILRLLEANGIKAFSFKGPAFAASAYGNLSFRQIKDLDLLVAQDRFQQTVDLFVGLGYSLIVEVPWEFHLESSDGSYSIDLHREIIPQHLSCVGISDYAWKHIELFTFQDKVIPTLTPEACLLILCLNGTKEYWQRLNRICDVAELIRSQPNLDWHQVLEQSKTMGFKRLTFLGLILARNFLDAKIPNFVMREIQSDSKVDSLILEVSEKLLSQTWEPLGMVETTFFHIRTRERWRDKIKCFLGLMNHSGWISPSKNDLDFLPLPKFLYFIYFFIRPFRIIRKYSFGKSKSS